MAVYSAAQLAALREAIATGATTISFEGRHITYRSLEEMIRIERTMSSDIAATVAYRSSLTEFHRP